jgi:Uma2 family endonuclease
MADATFPRGVTKEIPRSEWKEYLERFTRQHLMKDPPDVTVEVLSPTIGDQFEARTERLLGLTYDPKSGAVEVLLEDQLDHLAFDPVEIWAIEMEDGFVSTLELVRADGTRELLYIYRGGSPAPIYPSPFPA